jgi:hypothetical protein
MALLEKISTALGAELAKQVEEALAKATIEIGVTNDGTLVPAAKHDGLKDELRQAKAAKDDAEAQLTKVNEQLEELKNKPDTSAEVKAELEKVKGEYDTYKTDAEKRVAAVRKQAALERALLSDSANPDAIDYLVTLVDVDAVELLDDGSIKDFDKLTVPIKESKPSLFAKEFLKGNKQANPKDPDDSDMAAWTEKMNSAKTNRDRIAIKQEAFENGVILQ